MARELKIISDLYDLTLDLIGRIGIFPCQHRYSLGIKIERRPANLYGPADSMQVWRGRRGQGIAAARSQRGAGSPSLLAATQPPVGRVLGRAGDSKHGEGQSRPGSA